MKQANQYNNSPVDAPDGTRCHIETFVIYGKAGSDEEAGVMDPGDGSHITLGFMPMLPTSRGFISLQSADPSVPPLNEPNYYTTQADRYVAREAYRNLMRLSETPRLRELLGRIRRPWTCPR